jgi:hypothetical protein
LRSRAQVATKSILTGKGQKVQGRYGAVHSMRFGHEIHVVQLEYRGVNAFFCHGDGILLLFFVQHCCSVFLLDINSFGDSNLIKIL